MRTLHLATALAVCVVTTAAFAAPVLNRRAFLQSPVRGEPGDLLLLPGSGLTGGDRVVYGLVTNTTKVPRHLVRIPKVNSASRGEASVVMNAAGALTIRLPKEMLPNQSYVFWVTSSAHPPRWSRGVLINDARPLWISPDRVFASTPLPGVPRQLKVMGRNLQPVEGGATRVRLKRPSGDPITLVAGDDGSASTAIERYAATVKLPEVLDAGTYSVEVSRDGVSWVALAGQSLLVSPNPPDLMAFPVGPPCDSAADCDDTKNVAAVIATAAGHEGGGIVTFGPGIFKLGASGTPAPDKVHGLLVPRNVSITGDANGGTTIVRGAHWDAPPLFTLLGSNEIKNLKLRDGVVHGPGDAAKANSSLLQIGRTLAPNSWSNPPGIDNVMIHDNSFENAVVCIRDGGYPIHRLYIVNNAFVGWYLGIFFRGGVLSGDPTVARFNLTDSIVSRNTFHPGGYVDKAAIDGPIASAIGASYRLDFSDNVADGKGSDRFRAGFFFHMSNNHEMTLFAKNRGYCTGDRAGDGEFLSFDGNANVFGFAVAVDVTDAGTTSVTSAGTLQVTNPKDFYVGHWVQIVAGKGIGQARKIDSYSVDGGKVTFNVMPAWDVTPASNPDPAQTSRLTVGRACWQTIVVDNTVDNTGCALGPDHPDFVGRPESGEINLWATTADSVIEGNVQTGTDGINMQANYNIAAGAVDQTVKQFLEVRGNTILGEVNHESFCSWSGIYVNYGATPGINAPVMAYGVSIARNYVSHADGLRGGAIVIEDGGGQPGEGYPLVVNTLIHNNTIADLKDAAPSRGCGCDAWGPGWHRRSAIHLQAHRPEWGFAIAHTVLVGNTYPSTAVLPCRFLDDNTTDAVNLDERPPLPDGWCPEKLVQPPAGGWCPADVVAPR